MLVVFRADASIEIGTGHVVRCLSLASELKNMGHICWFICREHPGHLGSLIISEGYRLTLLPVVGSGRSLEIPVSYTEYSHWLGVPWEEDALQTLSAIKTFKPNWLVVDHYALDEHWQQSVASAVDDIMVIDDLANRVHNCTILVDQNLGRVESDYDGILPQQCLRLIGPTFALIGRDFPALRERSLARRKDNVIRRILISFGGSDRTNATGQVLRALENSPLPFSVELDIVMGAATPHLNEVSEQAANSSFKVTLSVQVRDMADRMCAADLSIGAAGGSAWERVCLGLPTILIVTAENQVNTAEALEKAGAAIQIDCKVPLAPRLYSILNSLSDAGRLEQMSKAAANITNGRGAHTVAYSMCARNGL